MTSFLPQPITPRLSTIRQLKRTEVGLPSKRGQKSAVSDVLGGEAISMVLASPPMCMRNS
jgi:hypothetical protein